MPATTRGRWARLLSWVPAQAGRGAWGLRRAWDLAQAGQPCASPCPARCRRASTRPTAGPNRGGQRAHRWRCPYVGRVPTYGQRALGTAPLVAAHRLTDLLLCPGMQAQAERPHALAWCLLCSDSGLQLDTTQYPAWANHPCASWLVIAASASVMACSKASSVRAALARTHVLTLDQHSSIGEKSGEY